MSRLKSESSFYSNHTGLQYLDLKKKAKFLKLQFSTEAQIYLQWQGGVKHFWAYLTHQCKYYYAVLD